MKMMMRSKLQRILNKLDGTNTRTASAISEFEGGVKNLREKLQQEISISTLEEVNLKINKFRKSVDVEPILTSLHNLETNFKESVLSILNDIENKSTELNTLTTTGDTQLAKRATELADEITTLKDGLDGLIKTNKTELNLINNELGNILNTSKTFATKDELSTIAKANSDLTIKVEKKKDEEVKGINKDLKEFRSEFMTRLANAPKGGGINRNIAIGGNTSTLSKYTDVNIKAGSNITLTYSNNNTTKYLDLTIASSGGGSVGGTVRQIQTLSVSSSIGTLAGTDQVYLCSAGIALTLPTAVSDTNLYTIKNVSNSSILIVGTIDDDASGIIMPIKYTSVDIISNDTDWDIT